MSSNWRLLNFTPAVILRLFLTWIGRRFGHSPKPAPAIYEILEVHFKVDDIVDAITVVNQDHVSADKDVTVSAWRRW